MKLECRAFSTLSTMVEVVMDDSMQRMAVMASSLVTSFLNISPACAATLPELLEHHISRKVALESPWRARYLGLTVSSFLACAQLFVLHYLN